MKFVQPILLSAACVLALSACASVFPRQPSSAPAAVVPAAVVKAQPAIQPAAAQVSAYGAANTGGTYPYGTAQAGGTAQESGQEPAQGFAINVPQQANAEVTEGVVVMGPDGTVWLRSAGENPAYRGDVDSCYAYARGQVDHDRRIESDVASAFDSEGDGFGLAALRGRMSDFERSNRVPVLFSSCMSSKGYNRQ